MKNSIQPLQLSQEGYTGLQGAQQRVHKVLKSLTQGTPIQYRIFTSDVETMISFSGNGIRVTLHIENLNIRKGSGL